MVKNLPTMQDTWVQSLGLEDPLEKKTSNPLQYYFLENSMVRGVWQVQSMGSITVRHDRVSSTLLLLLLLSRFSLVRICATP